jgi:hypothetical protein
MRMPASTRTSRRGGSSREGWSSSSSSSSGFARPSGLRTYPGPIATSDQECREPTARTVTPSASARCTSSTISSHDSGRKIPSGSTLWLRATLRSRRRRSCLIA